MNAENQGDKPYFKGKPHYVLAFCKGADYAPDFGVDVDKERDQEKP